MTYTIRFSDSAKDPIIIPNNTIVPAGTELDLTLFGKGRQDYGEKWDTNFLHLLENFANATEPTEPTEGQQWFDTSGSPKANLLKYRLEDGSWATTASQTYVNAQIGALLGSPAGLGPLPWSGGSAPDGWLLCKGDTVSRTTYSALFTAIGTTFNTGGEAGTDFRLPDMRGRFPLGQNPSGDLDPAGVVRSEAQTVGGTDGSENVTLTSTQMPIHSHSVTVNAGGTHSHTSAVANAGGSHSHTFTYGKPQSLEGTSSNKNWASFNDYSDFTEPTSTAPTHTHTVTIPQNSSSSHSHTASAGNAGSGGSHENTPPFLTVQYIIKT